MYKLLKAHSDLRWDLKTRGKTQALHSLHGLGRSYRIFCPNKFFHLPVMKSNDSSHCVLKSSIPCTPAQWCLWCSLLCNRLGNSSAFFCHRISWSYPLWSAESRRVIVPSDRCTSVCSPSLPSHNQLVKKRVIQLWASFANFKQKTILEAEASIVLNNYIVNLNITETLNN